MWDTVTMNYPSQWRDLSQFIHYHWSILQQTHYEYTLDYIHTGWRENTNDLCPQSDCGDLMESIYINHWFIDNTDQARSTFDQPANDKDKQQQMLKQIQESPAETRSVDKGLVKWSSLYIKYYWDHGLCHVSVHYPLPLPSYAYCSII